MKTAWTYLEMGSKKLNFGKPMDTTDCTPTVLCPLIEEVTPEIRHRKYMTLCKRISVSRQKQMALDGN